MKSDLISIKCNSWILCSERFPTPWCKPAGFRDSAHLFRDQTVNGTEQKSPPRPSLKVYKIAQKLLKARVAVQVVSILYVPLTPVASMPPGLHFILRKHFPEPSYLYFSTWLERTIYYVCSVRSACQNVVRWDGDVVAEATAESLEAEDLPRWQHGRPSFPSLAIRPVGRNVSLWNDQDKGRV